MPAASPILVAHHAVYGLPSSLALPASGIALWSTQTDPKTDPMPTLCALLSPDEQARAQRYLVAKARRQFVEVRGLLRVLLGSYLQHNPASLAFTYSGNGKPALSEKTGGALIQFNISHSQNQVLFAFCANDDIGVDIEGINPSLSYVNLAHRICTPQERTVFDRLPSWQQPQAFLKIWTRKEALVKLMGDRLYEKLSILEVPAQDAAGAYWVQNKDRQIWLQDLELVEGFAGAIALPTAPQNITHYDWHYQE
jgi:4'-phosphopantetheinyl transferase